MHKNDKQIQHIFFLHFLPLQTFTTKYSSVWSQPSKDHIVEDPKLFFKTFADDGPEETLFKVRFTEEKVMKAIEKLNKEAAAGPDGVSNL